MKKFFKHARSYVFRGFLAIIPLFLCVLAVRLLYTLIDKKVIGFLNNFFEVRQIPGLGIILVLVTLYLIGLIISNIAGRQILHFIDNVSQKIPFLGAIYSVGKQLSHGLSVTDKKAFQKAVLVDVSNANIWLPAFVTGEILNQQTQEKMIVVLIPTAPSPATGFVAVVKPSQIMDPGWSVEDCLKTIVSVGIIAPKDIKGTSFLG